MTGNLEKSSTDLHNNKAKPQEIEKRLCSNIL